MNKEPDINYIFTVLCGHFQRSELSDPLAIVSYREKPLFKGWKTKKKLLANFFEGCLKTYDPKMSTSIYLDNSLAYSRREFFAPQFDTNQATLFRLSSSSSLVSLYDESVVEEEDVSSTWTIFGGSSDN